MTILFCVLMGQRQIFSRLSRPLNQACNEKLSYFQPKHMVWVCKRIVSIDRSFQHPKQMLKLMAKKIFSNITLQIFVYQNLELLHVAI